MLGNVSYVTDFAFPVIFLQEHIVKTGHGSISVTVFGDQDKPALITYPDLALNCKCINFSLLSNTAGYL